tara:strand:- start:188 stop:505 length:318 start_codon:yes stop_codon:yes gene_type:complete
MSLKPDKNGNIKGFVKKDHHDNIKKNLEDKLIFLQDRLDSLENSYSKLEKNHDIFVEEYKKKCIDYNKLLTRLEQKKIKKEHYEELQDLRTKNKLYFEKYGSLDI